MLCTRKNPEMVLDLATYVRGNGPSVFAQRYCVPALPGLGILCLVGAWICQLLRTLEVLVGKMEVRMSAFARHGLIQDPEFFLPLFSLLALQ
jgi:hypothetical protein